MIYTTNYKLPLYEGSDPTSYLVTYNETMEKIDESLHELALKVASGEVNDRQFTSEISAIKERISSAESMISTLTSELATTNSNVSKNAEDIKTLQSQLVSQGTSIKNLLSEVSALGTSFESFKASQEQKNNAYEDSISGLSAELSNTTKKQELKNSEFTSEIAGVKAMASISKSYFDRHEKPTEQSGWQFNKTMSLSAMSEADIAKCSLNLVIGKTVSGHDKGMHVSITRYNVNRTTRTFYFADTSEVSIVVDFDKTAKSVSIGLNGVENPTIETGAWSLSILANVTLN